MQIRSLDSIIIHLDPSSMIIRIKTTEPIPFGWRLPSLEELGLYRGLAQKALDEKSKARVGDGWAFFGSYYGYQIKREEISGEQLLIRKESELALIYGRATSWYFGSLTICSLRLLAYC